MHLRSTSCIRAKILSVSVSRKLQYLSGGSIRFRSDERDEKFKALGSEWKLYTTECYINYQYPFISNIRWLMMRYVFEISSIHVLYRSIFATLCFINKNKFKRCFSLKRRIIRKIIMFSFHIKFVISTWNRNTTVYNYTFQFKK